MASKKPEFPPRIVNPRSIPVAPIKYRGALPHIFKESCTYFVTFCLADVTPALSAERKRLLADRQPSAFAAVLEPRPDSGACVLKNPDLARLVEKTMLHEQGEKYALSAWSVMPNHVHAVVTPFDSHPLGKILQAWKSVSSHRINRALNRKGPLWQRESFDHLVRDEESFAKFVDYTECNPVEAGLVNHPSDWPFGSARFGMSNGELGPDPPAV